MCRRSKQICIAKNMNQNYKARQSATQNYEVRYGKLQSALCVLVVLLQYNCNTQCFVFLQSTIQCKNSSQMHSNVYIKLKVLMHIAYRAHIEKALTQILMKCTDE